VKRRIATLDRAAREALLAAARAAAEHAYAPYSRYGVGAAVRTDDGRVFTGVNVENASYGLTICAERAAVAAAVAAGARRLTAVAIAATRAPLPTPCGACRQVLSEFAPPETPVYVAGAGGTAHRHRLGALLPHGFNFRPSRDRAP